MGTRRVERDIPGALYTCTGGRIDDQKASNGLLEAESHSGVDGHWQGRTLWPHQAIRMKEADLFAGFFFCFQKHPTNIYGVLPIHCPE